MALFVVLIMLFATFIQALAGFGCGLIAMPVLIALLGLDIAAPAFALTMQVSALVMIWRYRHALDWSAIWRVSLASLIAIPVGIWGAQQIPEPLVMLLLGLVIIAYASYRLIGFHVPRLPRTSGFGFGALGGLLHGAYNTGGPPIVLYATSQQWQPTTFKSNMQTLFFINGWLVIATHTLTGNVTPDVLSYVSVMIPAMIVGTTAGLSMDRFIEPQAFRRGVLVLLLLIGISLIVG